MNEERSLKKILLVDDDSHLLVTLGDFLKNQGFEVETATSGEEGLKKLPQTAPDLVILDMSMPGMGGIGFIKKLAPAGGPMPYPVLVFTARGIMREFFEGLDVAGFLAKPCEQGQLLAEIKRILQRQAVGRKQQAHVAANEPKKVLIAEDSPQHGTELDELFKREGYQVVVVRKGPEVIEKAVEFQPHAILMKRFLTGMNGDAVAEILKRMPSTEAIPVVIFDDSSMNDDHKVDKILEKSGAKRFIRTRSATAILQAVGELFT